MSVRKLQSVVRSQLIERAATTAKASKGYPNRHTDIHTEDVSCGCCRNVGEYFPSPKEADPGKTKLKKCCHAPELAL